MPGLNPALLFASVRLRSTFADEIGNQRVGTGTGFWIRGKAKPVLVTNRHNLDPRLLFADIPGLTLVALDVELRHYIDDSTPSNLTKMVSVEDLSTVRHHPDADCSILVGPTFRDHDPAYHIPKIIISPGDLARTEDFDRLIVQPMDTAFFIGFPGKRGEPFWDEYWQLAVARQCTIASHPRLHFKHQSIKTTHVLLVSGMSFSGSSGSPVYVPPVGTRSGVLGAPRYRPAKVIGIMSGHFSEGTAPPALLDHTGLSYLTRSSAIMELLDGAGESDQPNAGA